MISVCLASYNGSKYIEDQIRSILKQIGTNDELVISDDGSSDNTIDIINSFGDDRIKLFINKGERGFVNNFENSLHFAKGDYIFLADQDDVWVDGRVEKTIAKFREGYDFVYVDCMTTDSKLNVINNSRVDSQKIKPGFFNNLLKNRYLGCCMAFNKNVLNAILPFPKKHKIMEHDTWIALICNRYFKVYILKEPLIMYRRHTNNASSGGFKNNSNIFELVYKRIYRFSQVQKRKKYIVCMK